MGRELDLRQEREMWKIKLAVDPAELEPQLTEKPVRHLREFKRWYSEDDLGYPLQEVPGARWFGPVTSGSLPTPPVS